MIGERKAWQGSASLAAAIALSFGISFGTIWSELSIGNNAWSLCNCVSGLTQWAMPTLVCIMGSIFLTSPNPIRLSTLWRRFIPSSFLSCIIWWLASSVVIMHNNHPQDLDFLTFRECMAEALEAPAYIGFCHMLVSFLILYPLLYRIITNEKLALYTMLLIFAMSMVDTTIRDVPYLSAVTLFADQLNWGYYRAWAFYIIFGAWVAKNEFNWKRALVIYVLGILATSLIISLTSIKTNFRPGYANEYIGYTSPLTAMQTVAIVVFFKRLLGNRSAPLFSRLSKNFWHCVPVLYVSKLFTERIISEMNGSTLTATFFGALINIILGIFLVLALGQLPGFRILVGDYNRRSGGKMS